MSNFPYDHWQKYQTISGLAADQVISAIQKEIRRNHPENAATLAYEMIITSDELTEYLWFRLKTISVEDVGFGNILAPVVVNSLDQMRKTMTGGDKALLAIHNFWQIRSPGWVGLVLMAVLILVLLYRSMVRSIARRRTARQADKAEKARVRELEDAKSSAYASGRADAQADAASKDAGDGQ